MPTVIVVDGFAVRVNILEDGEGGARSRYQGSSGVWIRLHRDDASLMTMGGREKATRAEAGFTSERPEGRPSCVKGCGVNRGQRRSRSSWHLANLSDFTSALAQPLPSAAKCAIIGARRGVRESFPHHLDG
jgi:hypothetical protein